MSDKKDGYVEGFKDGLEHGEDAGRALALVFKQLSREAAALYRQQMDARLAKLVVDGQINYNAMLNVSEIFMESAFDCGGMAMFMNKNANIQHIDELREIVANFINKDKKS